MQNQSSKSAVIGLTAIGKALLTMLSMSSKITTSYALLQIIIFGRILLFNLSDCERQHRVD
jgi:hypothetical protein